MPTEQHIANSTERQALRSRLQLRCVTAAEEGQPISRIPNGVYGFTGAPSSEELPLFLRPGYLYSEVLKLAGGEIAWVGYVTESEATAIENGTEPLTVDLYPEPHGGATRLVCLPWSRVDRRKAPAREHGNPMRVDVAPK